MKETKLIDANNGMMISVDSDFHDFTLPLIDSSASTSSSFLTYGRLGELLKEKEVKDLKRGRPPKSFHEFHLSN